MSRSRLGSGQVQTLPRVHRVRNSLRPLLTILDVQHRPGLTTSQALGAGASPPGLFPNSAPESESRITFEAAVSVSLIDVTCLSDRARLIDEQRQDTFLSRLLRVKQGMKLPDHDPDRRLLTDLAETTEIEANGLLVQLRGERKVPWLPTHLRQLALEMSHDHPTSAHAGFFKTLKRVLSNFVWLGMRADVARHVCCCQVCQRTKARRQKPRGLMSSQWATAPMEELSVDIIGPLPFTPRRNKYLLVIIDKFTKFIELFPLRTATRKNITDCMVQVFCRHCTPLSISSERQAIRQ